MKLTDDKQWLLDKIEIEEDCVSVGGLVAELRSPAYAMALQLRGMVRLIRQNRQGFMAEPETVADMLLASAQLAAILKQIHMETTE